MYDLIINNPIMISPKSIRQVSGFSWTSFGCRVEEVFLFHGWASLRHCDP